MFIIRLSSMQLNLFANYWRNVFFRNLVLPRCFFFTYSWAAHFINNSDSWKKCIIRRKNAVLISNFINILVWMCADQLFFSLFQIVILCSFDQFFFFNSHSQFFSRCGMEIKSTKSQNGLNEGKNVSKILRTVLQINLIFEI